LNAEASQFSHKKAPLYASRTRIWIALLTRDKPEKSAALFSEFSNGEFHTPVNRDRGAHL
jgi:hypothetical protein